MRISDWSSDVCSSDRLLSPVKELVFAGNFVAADTAADADSEWTGLVRNIGEGGVGKLRNVILNQWIGPSQKREGKGTTERKHGVVDVAIFDTRKIRTGHPTEGSVAIGLRTKLLRVDLRRVIRAARDNIELRLIDIRERSEEQ